MEILGYFASILVGVTLGLLGGGGSILTIPILVYLFHLNAVTATAYSLFMVGSVSLIGAVPKYRNRLVDIKTAITFGLPSLMSIFITRKWIVPAIPDVIFTAASFTFSKRLLVLGLFAVLMILTSYSMIRGRKNLVQEESTRKVTLLVIEGLLIGILTGLVGAGGGFLIIPALVLLAGLPMKVATGTSLLIIGVNSLVGFIGDVINQEINWAFILSLTALAIAGIFLGNWMALRINGNRLRKSFGWLTLAMGSWILLKELFLS